jgi:hypothetical protein
MQQPRGTFDDTSNFGVGDMPPQWFPNQLAVLDGGGEHRVAGMTVIAETDC